VPAGRWLDPSVCEGWTIKDLADHVLGGNRFAVPLLAGRSAEEAFAAALEGGFDDDPVVSYRASAGWSLILRARSTDASSSAFGSVTSSCTGGTWLGPSAATTASTTSSSR
jgi:hypothetical protein